MKKNQLKTNKLFIFSFLLSCILFISTPFYADAANSVESAPSESAITYDSGIMPLADDIGWIYTIRDGKVYRRLYNYTKEKWIGNWELCP